MESLPTWLTAAVDAAALATAYIPDEDWQPSTEAVPPPLPH